jgi:Ser/Thr protein kinase RdoA (MazF antagonist)
MLPRLEQCCVEFLTPSLRENARRFADVLPEYVDQYSRGPQTLIHGDFRADNVAFPATAGGVIMFDWQVVRR